MTKKYLVVVSAVSIVLLVAMNALANPTVPRVGPPSLNGWAFVYGICGALVIYVAMYRESRIMEFASDPKEKWNLLAVDLVMFLVCGGLVAMFLLAGGTTQEFFMAGASWQGLVGGFQATLKIRH